MYEILAIFAVLLFIAMAAGGVLKDHKACKPPKRDDPLSGDDNCAQGGVV